MPSGRGNGYPRFVRLLTWNVQSCRGVDDRVDPRRIASEIRSKGADVACLQEVADGFEDLTGNRGVDQAAALRAALPGYECVTAWAVDVPAAGGRARFGNVVLSRLPVGRALRHSLPWPASPECSTMPRIALEAVVEAELGPVRVVTTHLEYHSAAHRSAQVARLAEVHREALAPRRAEADSGPYRPHPRPASSILCGDFNFPPEDRLHGGVRGMGLLDAWQTLHPDLPHPPTFRLHKRKEGVAPYCCDFVFLTDDLARRLVSIDIDRESRASDHQPVIVELR